MSIPVPRHIVNCEILVRFLYNRNFKKKIVEADNLIVKDLFLPNKGGVSMQRYTFSDENDCKRRARENQTDREFVGFVIFRKGDFENVKNDYIENSREDFEAEIIATPLDENHKIIPEEIEVFTNTPINPGHCDLVYKNPAVQEGESPNTAMRSFSRKLSKICIPLLDSKPHEDDYHGYLIKTAI